VKAIAGLLVAVPLASGAVLAVEAALALRAPSPPTPGSLDGEYGSGAGHVTITWLGDSLAAGTGAREPDGALPVLTANQLGRPVTLRVAAKGGTRVGDIGEEQRPVTATAGADVVLIAVGTNDATRGGSVASFRSSYRRLLGQVDRHAAVVLLGLPDLGASPRFAQPLRAVLAWRARAFDRVVRDLAAETGAGYVDLRATSAAFRARSGMFADDGYHPSSRGQELWARAVARVVGAMLPEVR
jgi:lysophospholipase L1-like esterase